MPPLARLVQQRWCSMALAGEGRGVEHGYTGQDTRFPQLPEGGVVRQWTDAEASRYLHRGYSHLLRACFDSPGRPVNVTRRTPLLRRVTRDVAQLEQHGAGIGPLTYTTYAELMARAGVMGRVVSGIPDKLRKLGYRPTTRLYNAVLQAYASYGKVDKVWQVRCAMRSDGAAADVFTYNAVLTCFLRRRDWRSVDWLHTAMRQEGIAPNDITYDKLIAAAPGRVAGMKLLEQMQAEGISLKPSHYVSLLAACRREPLEAMVREGLHVMETMRASSIPPSSQHYDALMTLHKEAGSFESLEQLLWQRVREGLTLTPLSYSTYLSACAAHAREKNDVYVANAEKCFEHAKGHGAHGYLRLYVEMMRVYVAVEDVEAAEHLARSLHGSLEHVKRAAGFQLLLYRLYRSLSLAEKAATIKRCLVHRWKALDYSDKHIAMLLNLSTLHNSRDLPGTLRPLPQITRA